jgi:DNA-binding response OmpR family regulator
MKKILIIDDDEEMCSELAEMLRAEGGFEVHTVFDGLDGRKALESNSYDVVVLDLKLPGLNGYQVLKSVRSKGQRIKILVLSGRPMSGSLVDQLANQKDEEDMVLALADKVMNKPFLPEDLLEVVKILSQ